MNMTLKRIVRTGLLIFALSMAFNALLWIVILKTIDVHPGFQPLRSPSPVILTFFGVSGAVAVFAWLARKTAEPAKYFRRIAVIALLLSFIPNAALAINPSLAPFPGATPVTMAALTLMHLAPAFLCIALLPTSVAKPRA